jgi:hypothetical protein
VSAREGGEPGGDLLELRHPFKVPREGLKHLDEDNRSTVMTSSSLRDQAAD